MCAAPQSEAGIRRPLKLISWARLSGGSLPLIRCNSSGPKEFRSTAGGDHKNRFLLKATRETHAMSKIWRVESSSQVHGLWSQTDLGLDPSVANY